MTLQEQIDKILELDAKRTQGEWKSMQSQSYREPHPIEFYYSIVSYKNGEYSESITDEETNLKDFPNAAYNFAFIATAPQMVEIIRKQSEMLKLATEALDKISYAKPDRLDHSIDVAIIIRAANVAKQALETLKQMEQQND